MNWFRTLTVVLAAGAMVACTTNPQTGERQFSKTAIYGLGAALTCGIIGAATHGGKGARNAALGCGAIGAGIGGYLDYQEQQLREKLASSNVQVERQGEQIKLTMLDTVMFAPGSAAIRSEAKPGLSDVGQVLSQYTDTSITIAGYADSVEMQKASSSLSQRRAQSVAGYLQKQGVAAKRITAVGYGANQQVAESGSDTGRAKNRRVEILINPKG